MFSEMIQNLLNSGGREAAMKRAAQINNYTYNNVRKTTPQAPAPNALDSIYPPGKENVQPFEKVLSKAAESNFGSLLLNPALNVNANIYSGTSIDTDNEITAGDPLNDIPRLVRRA